MSKKPAATPAHSSKNYPSDWQDQVSRIIGAMRQNQFDFGDERTVDNMQLRLDELSNLDRQTIELEMKLAEIRDIRKQKRLDIWQLASSIRTTVAGLYGKDSLEYQALGGTRQSERKPTRRKTKS